MPPFTERIAHRGARTECPENTLAAFRRAFERAADAIEIDVHATSDGVVIVHHDPDLALSVSRARTQISELTWREIAANSTSVETSVPCLTDVLGIVPPAATVYVELKGTGIEHLVAEVLASTRARCAVHSFDHSSIEQFLTIAPDVPRGLLFESNTDAFEAEVQRVKARDVWPHSSLVDADFMVRARRLGVRVIPWTVNDHDQARRLVRLGVQGICTDDVRLLDGI